MKCARVRPSAPLAFTFWVAVFALCAGLRWGSPLLLAAALAAPAVLLLWSLRGR